MDTMADLSEHREKPHSAFFRRTFVGLLVVNSALVGWGAWVHSPTTDEIAYLPAGIWHWTTGRFELASVSPPLVRMVAAIPVLVAQPKTDWSAVDVAPGHRSAHTVGRAFLAANGTQATWYFTIARWACIPFSWLGLYICWRWAGELYGEKAAVLAGVLWCFSPNLLAHGQLVTPDIGLTATVIAATYAFWRWLNNHDWYFAVIAGLALGVAELAKTTAIILFAVYPLIWLVDLWARRQWPLRTELLQLIFVLAIAILVINFGYGYAGSGRKLGDYEFSSQTLTGSDSRDQIGNRFRDSWLGELPVPLPADYVIGIDLQRRDFDVKSRSYLRGEFQEGGWWYYYLYGLVIKVPLGTWLLLALAVVVRLRDPDASAVYRDDIVLLLPPLVILIVVSSQTAFTTHLRYVLAVAPFAFIWVSQAAKAFAARTPKLGALVAFAVIWSCMSSLYVYPHSLSYFNEVVGGPRGGHAHLINSNIDWAQDLLYLRKWLDRNPQAKPLGLAFYGGYNPRLAGIDFELPPSSEPGTPTPALPAGWYAVSVNFLRGHSYRVINGLGETESSRPSRWTHFLTREPVGMAGYSIYIYHVPPTTAAISSNR